MHGLLDWEIGEILALAREWGEIDASHRKLAHRGSYEQRVWVSAATVFRVLLAHGQILPHRPAREARARTPWPDWVSYRPNQVWGYDLTAFTAARTQALAIVDLVSRKWIDHLLCPEATTIQVQALFTRALDHEGLLEGIIGRTERPADPADPDPDQPVLLAVSDNGPQMTSGKTREFMALHAIATHYGRPGVPTDQALIESFFGHLKHDWSYLEQITDPGVLDAELKAVRDVYNNTRLHAGIGYVTPADEHAGRGPNIRHARRLGLQRARDARLAYHRNHKNHHNP
ncbi:MAG: integrase [Solirubrobacterales bacterium]|nr:MAG: integrase [Solirubrobacterales bacterium]